MNHQYHEHNFALVVLSIVIAIAASYVALDLASSLADSKKRTRKLLLLSGAFAMGIGIWSMHFVAMLAMTIPSVEIAYDIPLMVLSIIVAIGASCLALFIASREKSNLVTNFIGSFIMGGAIAGMHYIGIASMRMAADIHWDYSWVAISIVIAVVASFASLVLCFKLRDDSGNNNFYLKIGAGVAMGFAISGMHYSGMAAMHIVPTAFSPINENQLLATDGLTIAVVLSTVIILGIALWGTAVDRAFTRRILMNEALEDAVRSRDNFLSIASHELKTPLTSIKLQTQLIMKQIGNFSDIPSEDAQKLSRMLSQTDKSVNRLTRLVDDMLDISRLSSNKMSLQIEEFNLSDLVVDIVERLQPQFNEYKNKVTVEKEANVVGKWDKFRLEQVLTNLLTNAARYGDSKPIEVKVTHVNSQAKILVKDHGRGIAKEDQERIFRRFERASSGDDIRGLGLGLFIAREILLMHKGNLSVESELNKGSEFTVSLPLNV